MSVVPRLYARVADQAGALLVAAAIIALWALVAEMKWLPRAFFPTPLAAFEALLEGFSRGELGRNLLGTVERMLYGWLLASIAGIAIGSAIGLSRTTRLYLQPTLEFFRPLPASAILPLAISLLGLSDRMVVAVIAFGAFWPTLLAAVHGVSSVEPRLIEASRLLGLSRAAYFGKIALPNALPDVLAGMRLALTAALILAVIGETMVAADGLGHSILLAARSFRAAELFAGVILLGLLGFASGALLALAERRLLRWRRIEGALP